MLWLCKKWLDKKRMVNSKFMTLQTGQHIIIIHTLPNIPRSEGNHIVKFGHLTEYNTSNIFLEKSYTKCIGEASPRPFNLFVICKCAEKVKLLQYTFHQFQYFITTCLCTVGIYQQMDISLLPKEHHPNYWKFYKKIIYKCA